MIDQYPGERSYRGPLKALILDWAGTTVDYGSRAPAAVFVARGVEISTGEARGRLRRARPHYLVNSVSEILPVLDDIDERLAAGKTPL